jgi:hypothetical protein
MTKPNDHLDPNDLAALADGAEVAHSEALHAHLAGCRSCLAAYAEAVRAAHLRARRPDAFTVPAELLAAALAAGGPRRRTAAAPTHRWRPALAAMAATAVVGLAVALAPGWQAGRLDRADITAISALLRDQSAAGPLLPGVGTPAGGTTPVYRSGGASTADLGRALQEAASRHGSSPRDPRQAFWLGAGYLGVGQLGTAVDLIRLARQMHPQDQPLLVLEGVAAYRASELARAEVLLREALRREPADAVARFDLAVVLADAGRTWEAQQVLAAGTWPGGSEVARRVAAMADSLP